MATSPPSGRREERRAVQQELGRAQLLDAAEELFATKGYHATTVKEIAVRAEYSVGSVYQFFAGKTDLFVQIHLRRGAEFMDGMVALLAEDRPPGEQLHALADYQVGFFRRHPHFGRLLLRDAVIGLGEPRTQVGTAVADRYHEAMALQADLFRQGQAAGVLRAGDPVVLAGLFTGLVSAYQSRDPSIMGDLAPVSEPMPLEELHAVLDGAFCP